MVGGASHISRIALHALRCQDFQSLGSFCSDYSPATTLRPNHDGAMTLMALPRLYEQDIDGVFDLVSVGCLICTEHRCEHTGDVLQPDVLRSVDRSRSSTGEQRLHE